MNKIIKNTLFLIGLIIICFYLWMGMMGGLYADGFLDLAAVEAASNKLSLLNFDLVCLLPPIAFGILAFDLLTEYSNKKLRGKDGDQNKD